MTPTKTERTRTVLNINTEAYQTHTRGDEWRLHVSRNEIIKVKQTMKTGAKENVTSLSSNPFPIFQWNFLPSFGSVPKGAHDTKIYRPQSSKQDTERVRNTNLKKLETRAYNFAGQIRGVYCGTPLRKLALKMRLFPTLTTLAWIRKHAQNLRKHGANGDRNCDTGYNFIRTCSGGTQRYLRKADWGNHLIRFPTPP